MCSEKWSTDDPYSPPAAVQGLIQNAVAAVIGEPVAVDQPLMAAGLDSVAALELQQGLADVFGLAALPPTLVFDHPTIAALAAHLHALTEGRAPAVIGISDALPRRPIAERCGLAAEMLGVTGASARGLRHVFSILCIQQG